MGLVADIAAVHDRFVLSLARQIRARKSLGDASGFRAPRVLYLGPDGELLRLQDEVLALEVAALAAPAPPRPSMEKKKP